MADLGERTLVQTQQDTVATMLVGVDRRQLGDLRQEGGEDEEVEDTVMDNGEEARVDDEIWLL